MSNEPRDPDNVGDGDSGSDAGDQTSFDTGTEPPPLVDESTAQRGDDAPADAPLGATDIPSDSTVDSGSDDTAPGLGAGDTASGSGADDTAPGLGADDTAPGLGADDTAPGLGADDTAPGLGADDTGAPPPPTPGPIYQAAPPVRRLTRDPYSRLGGVGSGIAHYYGIDVSLVRLAIVAFAVLTGIGFLLYLVAWLVIPRADHWPPPPPPGGYRSSRLDNRQLALGLIGLGLLMAVFAGGGAGSRVLISLGLVAGGIWIFNQRPAPPAQPVAPGPEPVQPVSTRAAAETQSTGSVGGSDSDDITTAWAAPSTAVEDPPAAGPVAGGSGGYEPPGQTFHQAAAYPPPQPVARRRRRIWPIVLIGLFIITPIALAVGGIVALIAIEGGDVSVSTRDGGLYEVDADTPAEIPDQIREGVGELFVDFTDLDVDDFDTVDGPIPVEIDMTGGEILIELPEDLPVDVNADIGAAGEITVFDSGREGLRPQYSLSEPDAVLELDVHLGVGEILIER